MFEVKSLYEIKMTARPLNGLEYISENLLEFDELKNPELKITSYTESIPVEQILAIYKFQGRSIHYNGPLTQVNIYFKNKYVGFINIDRSIYMNKGDTIDINWKYREPILPMYFENINEEIKELTQDCIANPNLVSILHDRLVDEGCNNQYLLNHFKNWIPHESPCKILENMLL